MKYLQKMTSLRSELEESKEKNKQYFDEIKESAQLVKSYWTGEAATAFTSKFDELTNTFNSYSTVLEEYINYLKDVDTSMEKLQEKNRNLFDD